MFLSLIHYPHSCSSPRSTDLVVSPSTVSSTADSFSVTVTVHNTGSVDGKEVVQIYVTDQVASVVVPNQQLVGFEKVDVP
jgi:beta-glucosidase